MDHEKEFLPLSSPVLGDAWATASLIEKLQAENRVLHLQLLEKKINESSPTHNDEHEEKSWKALEDDQEKDQELDLDSLNATQLQVEVLRRQLRRERRYRRYLQKTLTQEVQLIRVWIDHNRVRHREQLRRLQVKIASCSSFFLASSQGNHTSVSSGTATESIKPSTGSPMVSSGKEAEGRGTVTSSLGDRDSHATTTTSGDGCLREEVQENPFELHKRKTAVGAFDTSKERKESAATDGHLHGQGYGNSHLEQLGDGEMMRAEEKISPRKEEPVRVDTAKETKEKDTAGSLGIPFSGGGDASIECLATSANGHLPSGATADNENSSLPGGRTYYYKYSAPVHTKSEAETKSIIEDTVSRSEQRRKHREALRSGMASGVVEGKSATESASRPRRSPQSSVKFCDASQSLSEVQPDSPIRLRGAVGCRGDRQTGEGLLPPLAGVTSGLSASYSHSQFVNPNQIGEEIREDKRSKAWYVRHALRLAFLKAVRSEDGEEGSNTYRGSSSRRASLTTSLVLRTGAPSARSPAIPPGRHSPLSPLPSSAGVTSTSATSNPTGGGEAGPSSTITSALMGVNSASMQRAIQEVTHYYFYLSNNSPVLCTKPRVGSVRLEEENDDPDLLQALDASARAAVPIEASLEGGEKRWQGRGRGIPPLSAPTAISGGGGGRHASPMPPHQRSFSGASQMNNSNTNSGLGTSECLREDDLRISFHAPVIFNQIREFLGLSVPTFRDSVEYSIWRESLSPGKSGTSLIYFGDYVMKTLPDSDYNVLTTQYLPAYAKYCEQYPNSLLTRFYAIVSVKWLKSGLSKCYVLMQNVFTTRQYIHRIYDVKGSTVGRSAIQPGKEPPRTAFGALLLKDNDLPEQLLRIGPQPRRVLLAQLKLDLQFLQRLSIVDYSMMIGVRSRVLASHDSHISGRNSNDFSSRRASGTFEAERPSSTSSALDQDSKLDSGPQTNYGESDETATGENDVDVACLRCCDGGLQSLPIQQEDDTTMREEVYYLGVIDVLQEYNSTKKFENFAKGLYSDRTQISVIPPPEYAERLYKTIERISR